jgi:hypothetical protein
VKEIDDCFESGRCKVKGCGVGEGGVPKRCAKVTHIAISVVMMRYWSYSDYRIIT